MAKGLVRYQQCGCFHFVTFSCYRRQAHLDTPEACALFERSLEAMRRRYRFVVAGYVVMAGGPDLKLVTKGGWPGGWPRSD